MSSQFSFKNYLKKIYLDNQMEIAINGSKVIQERPITQQCQKL